MECRHLIATLRLDGRKEPEKRSIVYLDDAYADVEIYRGEIIMKCRTVKDADGRLRDCGWLFREVRIESVFHNLVLGGDGQEHDVVPTQEDDLLKAFSGLGATLEDAEEKSTAGQIEITLERVKLGRVLHGELPKAARAAPNLRLACLRRVLILECFEI